MNELHEMFLSLVNERVQSKRTLALFIKSKLVAQGAVVSDQLLQEIELKLQNLSGDKLIIEYDGILKEGVTEVELDLGDTQGFDDFIAETIKETASIMGPELIATFSQPLYDSMMSRFPAMLVDRQRAQTEFETYVRQEWGTPLDLLEMFIVTAMEGGDYFNEEYKKEADETDDKVFFCLARLHARACQIAWEVLTLLKSGFADGALARWRALHETTVTALFITKHGQSTADRYFHYDAIETHKAVEDYEKNCEKLNLSPLSDERLNEIKTAHTELLTRFGKSYGTGNYGWATSALQKAKVDYKDIEEDVDLSYLRPYYKFASTNIHASPRGLFTQLGLDFADSNIIPTGPSILGLSIPGHATAIALHQITTVFLNLIPSIDRILLCKILVDIEGEIGRKFGKILDD